MMPSSSARRPAVRAGIASALPWLMAIAPGLALAHTGNDGALHHGGIEALSTGFLHPFSGADHLAAMLAVGLWSALTMRRPWAAPLGFAGALWLGALMAWAGLHLPMVEPMIAASVMAFGLLVLVRTGLSPAGAAGVAGLFALFHGAAHGQELAGAFGAWALAGMVAATLLLHAVGLVLGLALRRADPWVPRAAGAGTAFFGLSLLAASMVGATA